MKKEDSDCFRVVARKGLFPPPVKLNEKIKEKRTAIQNYLDNMTIDFDHNIFGESFLSQDTIYIHDNKKNREYENLNAEVISSPASIIVNPLFRGINVIGVMAVFRENPNDLFSELDVSHFKTFTDYTSLTLENFIQYTEILEKKEYEKELSIARGIQQELLSKELNEFPDISVEAFSRSAKEVGGDYYNIKKLDENTCAVLICDVAGKGVPAAMIMVMIHSIYELLSATSRSPAEILRLINMIVAKRTSLDRFATMQCFLYDKRTKEVRFANAAHLPMLIYRNQKNCLINIDADGLPIGIEKSSNYKQIKFTLDEGDFIIPYTDGVTETMNISGEMYGINRFKDVILNNTDQYIAELKKIIIADIRNLHQQCINMMI